MARNMPMAMNQMMPQLQQIPKQGFGTRLKEGLFGSQGQVLRSPLLNPQQQQLQGLNIQNLMQMLSGGQGAPQRFDFAPIAQNAREQFTSQGVPGLAERFTALGGAGGQNSSAFQGALAQGRSGLESSLAAMGSQFGQQQQQIDQDYLLSLLRFALMPQFESSYIPGKSGFFGNVAGNLGQGLGTFGGLGALKYLGIL